MPSVIGDTLVEARAKLNALGIPLRLGNGRVVAVGPLSPEEAGKVFRQDPAPGTELFPRDKVMFAARVFPQLPTLVGHPLARAKKMVERLDVQLVVRNRGSNEPEGFVIEQNPPAGTRVAPGSLVTVVVASPRPV